MALNVLDIFEDGTTGEPQDSSLTEPGVYRWWHWDLNEGELANWVLQQLPNIPADALMQPETRPRCDEYKDGLILNLRGINLNEGQPADQMVSLRMWVTTDLVVTVRVRRVFAIEELRQVMITSDAPQSAAAFLQALVLGLTNRVEHEVMQLAERAAYYEADLEDDTTAPPPDLPEVRRRVIPMRRYLDPQRTALTWLAGTKLALIPEQDALHLRELANRTTLAVEELDALRDRFVTVQDEHVLAVARKQASHGYILSLAAGIFLPLGFLTGLFGVNIAGMPGLENPWAFLILCFGMAGLAGLLLLFLKLTRWL